MGTCEGRVGWLALAICAVMAAIELYTPQGQGAEMVSGMIYEPYEPYEQG